MVLTIIIPGTFCNHLLPAYYLNANKHNTSLQRNVTLKTYSNPRPHALVINDVYPDSAYGISPPHG